MMKKIIAGISALALSLTALSSMISAAEYGVSLGSGTTSTALEEGIAFISVYSEGLSSAICASGTIAMSVPSGTLSTEEGYIMASEKMGLSKKVGMKTYYPEFQCAVNADGSSGDVMYGTAADGLDTLVVSWGGAYAFAADANDLLCELMVVPTSDGDIDIELIYVGLDIYADSTLQDYETSKAGVNTAYVLAAGTSTITEKSSATATPEATPTPTPTVEPTPTPTPAPPTSGSGVIEADENDAAVWAWEEFTGAGNALEVTVDGVGTKSFKLGANVEGTAKVGIVIQYNPQKFESVSITDMNLVTVE